MYLSLPIPSTKNSKVDIQQCLDAFVKTEVMEKADAWYVIFRGPLSCPPRQAADLIPIGEQELPAMQNAA